MTDDAASPPTGDRSERPLWESAGYLAVKLGELVERRANAVLAPYGVTPRDLNVLARIGAQDGQSQQELSRALDVHAPALALVSDKLDRMKLIVRVRDDVDRRKYRLHLSDAGHRLLTQALAAVRDAEQAIFGVLGEAGTEQIVFLLGSVMAGAQTRS